MQTLQFSTKGHTDIVEITSDVEQVLKREKAKKGVVHLFVVGSTAALTVIEQDPNLYEDFREVLEEIAPYKKAWKHHKTWGDDNGAAHIRASLIGPSVSVPVTNGRLFLGTWQRIVLADFDTKGRSRDVVVTFITSE